VCTASCGGHAGLGEVRDGKKELFTCVAGTHSIWKDSEDAPC
jgi:hypothetical protein